MRLAVRTLVAVATSAVALCFLSPSDAAPAPPAAFILFPGSGTPAATGSPSLVIKSGPEVAARVWLFWDPNQLHVFFNVTDASPLRNSGDNWQMLFKTGDSCDLQLAFGTPVSPHTDPVFGDVRVQLTKTEKGPIAVLYRYKYKPSAAEGNSDTGANSVVYSSPTGRVTIDRLEQITTARIDTQVNASGYTLHATIPWKSIAPDGFVPKPGLTLSGDAGVLFSDPDGQVTVERCYWANKDTAIVADVPTEVGIRPDTWGQLTFGPVVSK